MGTIQQGMNNDGRGYDDSMPMKTVGSMAPENYGADLSPNADNVRGGISAFTGSDDPWNNRPHQSDMKSATNNPNDGGFSIGRLDAGSDPMDDRFPNEQHG